MYVQLYVPPSDEGDYGLFSTCDSLVKMLGKSKKRPQPAPQEQELPPAARTQDHGSTTPRLDPGEDFFSSFPFPFPFLLFFLSVLS